MSENSSESVKPRRRGGGLVLLLLVLALLAALAGGGWYGWQYYQRLTEQARDYRNQLAELQDELSTLRGEHEKQLSSLREDLEEVRSEAAARREELQALRSGGQTTWLLNEAESLASLAQQRLLLSGDRAAAERLLEAADRVLARIEDPEVTPVREALAADLEKVRGARQVDTTGLVLRLGGLRSLVTELAVPAGARGDGESDPQADPEEADNWWQRLPLTIRRHDEALPLPLDDTRASLVRLQLFNELQRAQLAVMQSRPELYRDAVDSMLAVVEAWFPADRPRVKQLNQALTELRQAPVEQALPEIGGGLQAIRGLIGERGDDS